LLDLERWQSDEMRDVPIPTSVQGLISSRLDRLESKEKRLAHHASVIGAVFWVGAVAHLGAHEGSSPEDPRPGLAELERRDFVAHLATSTVAADDEYAFKHILMRDVAYRQVPKGRRAQLHLGFSEWVKGLPSSADEFVEIVAWHLEQACLLSREVARSPIDPPIRQAAATLADAAQRAERRESLREAHRYYTRALDVLAEDFPELRAELRVRRADMAMMLGELKEATDELLEVAENAAELSRHDVESEALLLLGDIDQRQGRPTDARSRLLEAERLAGLTHDARLQIRVAFVLATYRGDFEGQHEQAIEALRSAMLAAEEIDQRALLAEGHLRIAAILLRNDLASAEAELRRCLEVAAELGSHRIEAEATSWLGAVVYYRGRPVEGERLSLQARTWFERTGDSYFQVQNLISGLAIFALEDGRAEEAEAWLREALPVALQIGGWVVLKTYWHLVEAHVGQDRLDDAREIVAFAGPAVPLVALALRVIGRDRVWRVGDGHGGPRGGSAPARGDQLRARCCRSPIRAGAFAPCVRRRHRCESRARACPRDVRPTRRGHPARRRRPCARGTGRGAGSHRSLDCVKAIYLVPLKPALPRGARGHSGMRC
jgi:tetratricopeptide (TPR) repeat protein